MNNQTPIRPTVRVEAHPVKLLRFVPDTSRVSVACKVMPCGPEPSAETAYGCVEWFAYDRYPLKTTQGKS